MPMINFFSKLRSCYPNRRPPPPFTHDAYSLVIPIHTSDGYRRRRRARRNGLHRYPQSDWRPALSVIMEETVVQDHHNVNRKSGKKSSGKSRSTVDVDCFSQWQDSIHAMNLVIVYLDISLVHG
ncbi:uncharacterized protein G2W53_037996 [Senna tora]|uniref:Uncharacterized protein n=1 Tax=Senna tora TaxID=362788 RepID=A0A834W1N4_9FABA|nr:uncharacterized protein G2W53_037996 [Senna tora]